jgi:hypothetical protein
MNCLVENIRFKFPALEGRQMVAPGQAAKRTQPGVTIPKKPTFSSFAPVKADDEKASLRPGDDHFYKAKMNHVPTYRDWNAEHLLGKPSPL